MVIIFKKRKDKISILYYREFKIIKIEEKTN